MSEKENKKKYELSEIKKDLDWWRNAVFIILFLSVFIVAILLFYYNKLPEQSLCCWDCNTKTILNYTELFDTIGRNCNSTFITKKWNNDSYFVFTRICLKDSYCKSEYIPVENCLGEKKI